MVRVIAINMIRRIKTYNDNSYDNITTDEKMSMSMVI